MKYGLLKPALLASPLACRPFLSLRSCAVFAFISFSSAFQDRPAKVVGSPPTRKRGRQAAATHFHEPVYVASGRDPHMSVNDRRHFTSLHNYKVIKKDFSLDSVVFFFCLLFFLLSLRCLQLTVLRMCAFTHSVPRLVHLRRSSAELHRS